MNNKKAFTFFELLIVIVLIVSAYGILFTNFELDFNKKKSNVSLSSLKSYLLDNYDFEDNVKFSCINDGLECFVFVDNIITKENKIDGFFKTKPEVFSYSKNLDKIDFKILKFEQFEDYEVCFEYKINKDRKSDDLVVVVDEKVFVFNSINNKPDIYNYLDEVTDLFDSKISEVKDAF